MILKSYKKLFILTAIVGLFFIALTQSSCSVYRFNDASIPDSLKYIMINQFDNKASYINPSLAPELTTKLRQKIVNQTKIITVNNTENAGGDGALWIVNCKITTYSFSTSGISNQQVNTNRLTVGVNVEVIDGRTQKPLGKYDVSTPFDYSGGLSLQQAEQELSEQMMRDIPDAIFNRIFSNW